jgi:hypothetical protein
MNANESRYAVTLMQTPVGAVCQKRLSSCGAGEKRETVEAKPKLKILIVMNAIVAWPCCA